MTLVASGGVVGALAAWQDAGLLASLFAATLVVLLAMRTAEARARLAPVLIVLTGLMLTLVASLRVWS